MMYYKEYNNRGLTNIILGFALAGFISSLLLGILKELVFEYINWVIGGIVILSFVSITVMYSKISFFVMMILFMMILKNICIGYDCGREVKDSMNFLCCIIILIACSNRRIISQIKRYLDRHIHLIRIVLYVSIIESLILMGIPAAYSFNWGDRTYSAFNTVQGTAANCILFLAMSVYLIAVDSKRMKDSFAMGILVKRNIILLFGMSLNVLLILMTEVRAALFSVIAILLLLPSLFLRKQMNKILLKIIGSCLFVIILLNNSNFLAKMRYSQQQLRINGFTMLDALLSSRPIIWRRLLSRFFMEDHLANHLFGAGFSKVYEMNISFGRDINAHSDIVTVIIGLGFCGLVLFLFYSVLILFKYTNNSRPSFALFLFYIIPSCLNGIIMTPPHIYAIVFCVLTVMHLNSIANISKNGSTAKQLYYN